MMLEEERRLMYVAATRAKDRLVLCYPGQESMPFWASQDGLDQEVRGGLSSFISGLGNDVVAHQSGAEGRRMRYGTRDAKIETLRTEPEGLSKGLRPGDRVRHPAFGTGVISRFLGKNRLEVLFRDAGRKLLQLEYTTLEKI
jgi:DNA helicase-2/ATP-dependent DNA helicase PcrA